MRMRRRMRKRMRMRGLVILEKDGDSIMIESSNSYMKRCQLCRVCGIGICASGEEQ